MPIRSPRPQCGVRPRSFPCETRDFARLGKSEVCHHVINVIQNYSLTSSVATSSVTLSKTHRFTHPGDTSSTLGTLPFQNVKKQNLGPEFARMARGSKLDVRGEFEQRRRITGLGQLGHDPSRWLVKSAVLCALYQPISPYLVLSPGWFHWSRHQ